VHESYYTIINSTILFVILMILFLETILFI